MVATRIFQSLTIGAAGFGLALTFAAAAQAQSNGGSMNAGFGHSTTSDGNIGVSAGTRDANGNRVIIDGIIQGGLDQSSISSTSFGSFSSLGPGAGAQAGEAAEAGARDRALVEAALDDAVDDHPVAVGVAGAGRHADVAVRGR